MKTYDLVIIGSGTAAQVASSRVRAAGWSVALVDHRPFGGTCALRGCDPKKMLISGAEAIDAQTRMRGHGVTGEADRKAEARSTAGVSPGASCRRLDG
jgi:glutathione reductase (NADPH)